MLKKLSALRGFAAFYVFVHHFIGFTEIREHISPIMRFPFRFGQEAVILFFILSGFVIHYSSFSKKLSFNEYMFKRIKRIYPIFMASILVSVAVFYTNGYNFKLKDIETFFGNLFMLQYISNKPGLWVNVFLENHALWSLSYEFIFYLLYFPIIQLCTTSKKQITVVLLTSIFGWVSYLLIPNHLSVVLSYLIIWWTGVECAKIYIKHNSFSLNKLIPIFSCLIVMSILSLIPVIQNIVKGDFKFNPIMYPIITARHFIFATIILVIGWFWWRIKLIGFNRLLGKFYLFSSISYGLYVIHFPIIYLKFPSQINWILALIIKIILIFFLSYFLELKLQSFVNNLLIKKSNNE